MLKVHIDVDADPNRYLNLINERSEATWSANFSEDGGASIRGYRGCGTKGAGVEKTALCRRERWRLSTLLQRSCTPFARGLSIAAQGLSRNPRAVRGVRTLKMVHPQLQPRRFVLFAAKNAAAEVHESQFATRVGLTSESTEVTPSRHSQRSS